MDRLVVAVDAPHPASHLGLGLLAADGSTATILDGAGGEHPAASRTALAAAFHDEAGYRLLVWPLPLAGTTMPVPAIELPAPADRLYLRPALSADARRLAALELDPSARPARLLLWDLAAEPRLIAEVDVAGALEAGPAWVANAP
jgi:hypothetical protein